MLAAAKRRGNLKGLTAFIDPHTGGKPLATRDDFWLQLNDLATLLRTEFSKRDQTKQLRQAFDAFPANVQEQLCDALGCVVDALNKFDDNVRTKCEKVKKLRA